MEDLIQRLACDIRGAFGTRLIGLYLCGSVAAGTYEEGCSDIDLIAAIEDAVTEPDIAELRKLHRNVEEQDFPDWRSRIEVLYVPIRTFATFRRELSTIGVISPGEPLHLVQAGSDWLINWYMLRESGRSIFGPRPTELVPPISHAEYLAASRSGALEWRQRIVGIDVLPSLAYGILTVARAYYTSVHGTQPSKRQAAEWLSATEPRFASLLQDALEWRRSWRTVRPQTQADAKAAVAFVEEILSRL